VLALDADAAGQMATLRGLDVARQVFDQRAVPVPTARGLVRYESQLDADIRILALPDDRDPDEVIRADPAQWERLVAQAQPIIEYVFAATARQHDIRTPRGKSEAVQELAPLIREVTDHVRQAHYVQRLGRRLEIDDRAIWDVLRQARPAAAPSGKEGPAPRASRLSESRLEPYILALILGQPELLWQSDLHDEDFQQVAYRQVFHALDEYLRDHETMDLDALRGLVDPSLHETVEQLTDFSTHEPQISSYELAKSLKVAVLRLRRRNAIDENTRLHFVLIETPTDERRAFGDVHKRLSEQLIQIDRALAEARFASPRDGG
jgi:DNA primase